MNQAYEIWSTQFLDALEKFNLYHAVSLIYARGMQLKPVKARASD